MINELDCRKRPRKASKEDNIKLMRAMNYTKVLTPKNMKSEVWGYFGFPGNGNNDIVTKNVLICTICYVMFRNNRNTTNLRMHLERVHKIDLSLSKDDPRNSDIFENNDAELYASSPSVSKIKQARPKMKIFRASELPDFQNDDDTTFDPLMENSMDVDNSIYPHEQETSYEIIKPKEEIIERNRSITQSQLVGQSTNIVMSFEKPLIEKNLDIISSVRDMVITDLMPTCFVQNNGFQTMLQKLTKYNNLPTKDEIENSISALYTLKSTDLIYELKFISSKNPFSLSYEIWENIENSVFITFYFHYLKTDGTKEILKEVLLKTIKLTNYINFEDVFEGFNMKNCVAVIAAYSTDLIETYFTKKKISILPCFECIVKNCINKIFSLSTVESIYTEVKDTLQDFITNHEIETPNENRNLPWAKYNILKFFIENIVWPEDPNNEILPKAKSILETLSPLKITIDSLAEEPDALNSVSKPLAMQLIDNHFRTNEDDTQTVTEIKEIIYFEFANNILSNEIFSVSAFLDPRFQQYLGDDCFPTVKTQLVNKAKELNLLMCLNESSSESFSEGTTDSPNTSQKKGLKMLFGRKESTPKRHLPPTNENLDNDIKKYTFDANADLDESPLDWWNRYGYMYGNLKKLANIYNSIPCLCTKFSLKPIEKQIEIEDRKLNLKGNLINEILFLNYNLEFNNFSTI